MLEDDRDLLGAIVSTLEPSPVRVLQPKLELRSAKRIEGEVRTRGLQGLRILVDDDEREHRTTLEDGTHELKLGVTGHGPYVVDLRGEGSGGELLARRKITLGGV